MEIPSQPVLGTRGQRQQLRTGAARRCKCTRVEKNNLPTYPRHRFVNHIHLTRPTSGAAVLVWANASRPPSSIVSNGLGRIFTSSRSYTRRDRTARERIQTGRKRIRDHRRYRTCHYLGRRCRVHGLRRRDSGTKDKYFISTSGTPRILRLFCLPSKKV